MGTVESMTVSTPRVASSTVARLFDRPIGPLGDHERVHRSRRQHSPHANDVAPNSTGVSGHRGHRYAASFPCGGSDRSSRRHHPVSPGRHPRSPHRNIATERRGDHVDAKSEVHRIPGGVRGVPASEARDHSRDVNRHRQRRPVRLRLDRVFHSGNCSSEQRRRGTISVAATKSSFAVFKLASERVQQLHRDARDGHERPDHRPPVLRPHRVLGVRGVHRLEEPRLMPLLPSSMPSASNRSASR